MISYRIKFSNIISELYLPENANRKGIIFLPGLPSYLGKNGLTKELTANGYTVFQPFYSGSFDSGGNAFNPARCVKDVNVFVKMTLQKSHQELYFNKRLENNLKETILIGISYGSSVAALSCQTPEISKIVLISPILTYNQKNIDDLNFNSVRFEDRMHALIHLLKNAYPYSYRITNLKHLENFLYGKNTAATPITYLAKNLKKSLLILHGQQDEIVPAELTKALLSEHKLSDKCTFKVIQGAGHSISGFYEKSTVKFITDFIEKNDQ